MAKIRAFRIADNRLSEKASWDLGILVGELSFLAKFDLKFDFSSIGFETTEIDILLDASSTREMSAADTLPEMEAGKPATSSIGDLWIVKTHRTMTPSLSRLLVASISQ